MKNIFVAFFMMCFLSYEGYTQSSVTKDFVLESVKTSESKQKANLVLIKEDEREFEIPDSLGRYDYRIYKNELRYHLTDLGDHEKEYQNQIPILLCYDKNKYILSLDTDSDNSFKDEEFQSITNLDSAFTVNFNFIHKTNNDKSIVIPVLITVNYFEMSIRLNIQYDQFLSTGELTFNGNKTQINFFPYTAMARYEITENETNKSEIYFRNELIDVDGICWRIDSFDYPAKKLLLDSIGVVERPIGYKIGQYVDQTFFEKCLDKMSVNQAQIDLAKSYTVLHFWGDWCQPCLKEIPRLKKLLLKVDHEKINIIHVNYLVDKSNKNAALEFINSSELEGAHVLDDSSDEFSLVKFFKANSFPSYVIFNKDFKIIYRSDEMEINLPAFLKSKGVL